MLEKIKTILLVFAFSLGFGGACAWLIGAWIKEGRAPVDFGTYSEFWAPITSTLLILVFGICSIATLVATVALFFVDSAALAKKEKEEGEEEREADK
mgnify:CR=1 FL=1|jgi:hypothetical protein